MAFVSDTFTDTDAVNLSAHTGEVGATWTVHVSSGGECVIKTNRIRGGSGTRLEYASGSPAGAEQTLDFTVTTKTATGSAAAGLRVETGADTGYYVRYNNTGATWELIKVSAGTVTVLHSYAQTLTVDQSYAVFFNCLNATKTGDIDGVNRLTSSNNDITAAGKVAVRIASGGATTGFHLDTLVANDVGGTVHEGNASLQSVATITPTGSGIFSGVTQLQGVATLTASVLKLMFADTAATLQGVADVLATSLLVLFGIGDFQGVAGLDINGRVLYSAQLSMQGVGDFTSVANVIQTAISALQGVATIQIAGTLISGATFVVLTPGQSEDFLSGIPLSDILTGTRLPN